MSTALVLLTRDLRVHDHPALDAACRSADRVVVLFVLDEEILASRMAAANRVAFLLEALADVDRGLAHRGGALVVRRGDTVGEVATLVRDAGVDQVHVSGDASAFAARRERGLARLAADAGVALHVHPGVSVVPPHELTTTSGGAYRVFTPYWRRWADQPGRTVRPPPARVRLPDGVDPGRLPGLEELVTSAGSPARPVGGEHAARRRLQGWLDGGIDDYDAGRDRLGDDGSSRLSADLRFGCLSPTEVVARLDPRRRGHEAFLRQLCWRDFNHQLLAGHPDLPRRDLRQGSWSWHDDPGAVEAWRQGRTGYPVVDAGMRQLREEGWMHNRARMLTAAFLTKHLRVDWRVGAAHFLDWLVDGELANNSAQWQWMAGTGTDTRPGRMPNPVAQGRRHDPQGDYVRRYVPELRDVDPAHVHAPWEAPAGTAAPDGYPPPLVDHREARARFLTGGRA